MGGGLGLGFVATGLEAGRGAGAGGKRSEGGTPIAKPPMASRALAPSRTASDILMGVLAPSADSSSTSSVVALATRGVTSTHTPVGFWFHQRLCATKVPSASSSSYTAYPLITSQPHACWTASALANEFSTSMLTAALTLDRSSLLGPAVRRQRLPASCFLPSCGGEWAWREATCVSTGGGTATRRHGGTASRRHGGTAARREATT